MCNDRYFSWLHVVSRNFHLFDSITRFSFFFFLFLFTELKFARRRLILWFERSFEFSLLVQFDKLPVGLSATRAHNYFYRINLPFATIREFCSWSWSWDTELELLLGPELCDVIYHYSCRMPWYSPWDFTVTHGGYFLVTCCMPHPRRYVIVAHDSGAKARYVYLG